MRIAGIIAEYNPFHLGHAWHIRQTRRHCDAVVVCMAGSYTQRGEAACLSKWDRARMALSCGADAVFELPALFAVRPADAFARGGVGILDGLGADVLSFGSEVDDAAFLNRLAELRSSEPEAVTLALRRNLDAGMSHARAWGEAAAAWLGVEPETLNAPNAILGAEYIRAIRDLGSGMDVLPVPRRGDYRGQVPDKEGFPSAIAVRLALREGRMEDALAWTPPEARAVLAGAPRMHAPDDLLLGRLRAMSEEEIAALPGVGEGLERRIKRLAASAASAEELAARVKCKRYTRARLTRLMAHALLDMTEAMTLRHPRPEYARLIGMRSDAGEVLRELKRRARLPVISDPVRLKGDEMFRLECRATDLRALQCDEARERRAGQELTQKFVRV